MTFLKIVWHCVVITMWSDVCELAVTTVIVNDNGVEEKSFAKNEVFCNEKSVTSDEYYKSCQEGNEIKIVLEVKQVDYNKEPYVFYDNNLYKVKRTYKTNKEDIELHLYIDKGLINE